MNCPKCGLDGYEGLLRFDCENLRCDNNPFRQNLRGEKRRQIDTLWDLYDKVEDEEAKEVIWERIWTLMNT